MDAEDGTIASAKHPRKWAALLQMSARLLAEPVRGEPAPDVEITCADGTSVRSDDPDVDRRLSDAVGRQVRLKREHSGNGTYQAVWPSVEGLVPQRFLDATTTGDVDGKPLTSIPLGGLAPPRTFFDVATMHVLTTSTLRQLADSEPAADFDPRRYRPNLLIEDAATGFVEDEWVGGTLEVGEQLRLSVAMPTMRCVMTTLAQRDLAADPQTLRTVASQHRATIPGLGTWACAGVYATVAAAGTVRPGDRTATREH